MAKKAVIWTVAKPFFLEGINYDLGDEWVQPANYTLDEAATAAHGGSPTFNWTRTVGSGKEQRVEVRTAILPLASADA